MNRALIRYLPFPIVIIAFLVAQAGFPAALSPPSTDRVEASRSGLDYDAVNGPSVPNYDFPGLELNQRATGIGPGASADWALDTVRFHFDPVSLPSTITHVFIWPARLYADLPGRVAEVTVGPLTWSIPLNVSDVQGAKTLYVPWESYVSEEIGIHTSMPGPAVVLPISPASLLALPPTVILHIRLDSDVVWMINAVGVRSVYETQVPFFLPAVTAFALACLAGLIFVVILVRPLRSLFPSERTALALSVAGLLAGGLFVEDVWDLQLWRRYADYAIYGGGNPNLLWGQHPLWPYVATGSYALFVFPRALEPTLSPLVGSLALKMPAIAGYIVLALVVREIIARLGGSDRAKRWAFLSTIWNPVTVWVTLWGQRDVLASALFLGSVLFLLRKQSFILVFATLAVACAIEEYVLLAFPAFFAYQLLTRRQDERWRKRVWESSKSVGAFAAVLGLPLLLVPRGLLVSTYTFRAGTVGGSSYLSLLGQVLDPNLRWIVGGALFLIFLIPIMRRLIRSPTPIQLLVSTTAVVLAFYLAAPSVNPQYLVAVVPLAAVVTAMKRMSPWWLVSFSIVAMVQTYAHFGFGEFVSPIIMDPFTAGLFEIRGALDRSLSAVLSLFAASAFVALFSRRGAVFPARLTKPHVVGFAAVGLLAIPMLAAPFVLDAVVLIAAVAALVLLTRRYADALVLSRRTTFRSYRWDLAFSMTTFGYLALVLTYEAIVGRFLAFGSLCVCGLAMILAVHNEITPRLLFWLQAVSAGFFGATVLTSSAPDILLVLVGGGFILALLVMLQCEQ